MLQEAWHRTDVRPYGDRVLVGGWLASQQLQRARLDLFRRDYEQGVLALQNTRRMKDNLLRPQALAAPDALLRLGDVVQVLAPDMPAFSLAGGRGHLGVFLAGTVDEGEVDRCQFLSQGSQLHGSAQTEPCARNAWRLCAEDGTSRLDGCPLRLGQCFTLRAVEAAQGTRCPLYVRAQCNTTNEVGCGPPRLELSTTCDTYCRWRALHCDKHRRPETDGGTFPANMRVVLQHAASNLNLAAPAGGKRHWVLTFFGRECKIGLKNYTDQYGQVTSENVWMLGVQRLRDRRSELPCPPPELNPPPAPPPDPCPAPGPDPCAAKRPCPLPPPPPPAPPLCPPPPPPCPPPEQRKSDCVADMTCNRDTKCGQPPPLHPLPPRRADLWRGDKPCPRDPPCPQDCSCSSGAAPGAAPSTAPSAAACPPRKKCLRWKDLHDNSMWCSWHKYT
ncbi:Cilia- and flagella-associated protein 161 [Frankliniella fusca]|uniref:Cilia- and flagella-associated protein 161 n=1 Tax=Frankliniella fusca TaxID=407009 RepID=A0AAE1HJX9_9NEOP|nr:Cilia- and flagella-associated protein 161 [Frankliniella fusca]